MPVVITQEEKALPYAKYFYQDLAPIPQEKLDIWHGPMADPALATPVERRNDFLEEGKVALEVGFTVAPNGTGFVANSTFMARRDAGDVPVVVRLALCGPRPAL